MFGNSVIEFAKASAGTYGYTVKVDTSTLLADQITEIQAQASSSDTPPPVKINMPLNSIQGYLNNANAPDLAFNYTEGVLTVFLKTSVFPYVSATRLALFGYRQPQPVINSGDLLDCPDKDYNLIKAYALREAYRAAKQNVPRDIEKEISDEERRIRNEQ